MTTVGRIYLGLPAYNEEIALPRLLTRIEGLAQSSQLAITVVVYNDGSTDRTAAIAGCQDGSPEPVETQNCINATAAAADIEQRRFWAIKKPASRVANPGAL